MLDADDLNATDRRLLALLTEGRITPEYATQRLDSGKEYIQGQLRRLREHDLVYRPVHGLYAINEANVPAEVRAELPEILADIDRLDSELEYNSRSNPVSDPSTHGDAPSGDAGDDPVPGDAPVHREDHPTSTEE